MLDVNVFHSSRRNSPAALLAFTLTLLAFCHSAQALYEDQIGKFDWKQSYIGPLKEAFIYGPQTDPQIVAATTENVLAVLSAKSGAIIWRKVFEKHERGAIKYVHVDTDPTSLSRRPSGGAGSSATDSTDIITVSGVNPALVRGWDSRTGNLGWEWSLVPLNPVAAEHAVWFYDRLYMHHVVPHFGSHLEVTVYDGSTGQQTKQTSARIQAAWTTLDGCVLAAPYYACVVGAEVVAVDLTANDVRVRRTAGTRDMTGLRPTLLRGAVATIVVGDDIFNLNSEVNDVRSKADGAAILFNEKYMEHKNVLLKGTVVENTIQFASYNLESGDRINEAFAQATYTEEGRPQVFDVKCKGKSDGQSACRILLSNENGAITFIQQGKVRWSRQEALTNIAAIEMIDLPLSDAEGSIENELKNKDGDIVGALVRRISSQIMQAKNLVLTVLGLGQPPSATQKAGLVRDAFGLHKMMVIVTASGKLFGMDNVSGKHHWTKYLPNFTGFNNGQPMQILVQRSSGHFPHQAQCVIVAKNKVTGNGILYQFNPISGNPVGPVGDGIISLDYAIRQITLLHETKADFLKSILMLDQQNQVHVYPETAAVLANGMYLYTADKETSQVSGFYVSQGNERGGLTARPIWQLNLGGTGNAHKITNIAIKNPIEHVHSQGRVFNDRSVLYKYINPNLVVIATQGPDAVHKTVLNVHMIDVVSGGIISSMSHRKVKGPVHMVHSENWLVYSYYNDKVRRTEITSVELYEGKSQANSTVWSSLDAPQLPMVERQSYIIPANVVTLQETITEKGITNKNILVALSSGSIIEMPWVLLDPRRPVLMPNQPREEGIIPYIPELHLPSESVINYNQSVANIRGIHVAPSGLESTCLVVAHGLDLFVTRVAPSKTFDLLKEDFDYILISVVLAALTIASVIVKHLSSRKALKQAWK